MSRLLYTVLFYLALPLVLLRLWWRGRSDPEYRLRIAERFGFYQQLQTSAPLWLHLVSVGETIAARPIVEALLAQYPEQNLLITGMTPTGSAQIKSLFGDRVVHCYAPYDVPDAINRFLSYFKPKLLAIMETELWPNTIAACSKAEIPICLLNARLSERSAVGYAKISALSRPMLKQLTWVAAQGEQDAQRLLALGVRDNALNITGSVKFDLQLPEDINEQGLAVRRYFNIEHQLVWLAGSTHADEEKQLIRIFSALAKDFDNLVLIIVPRHRDRFDQVWQLIEQTEFASHRRSAGIAAQHQPRLLLGDTMGELLSFYSAADFAFVGGTLVENGGHNFLEPAALGKPILSGPHLFNFAAISELLINSGAMQVADDAQQLQLLMVDLLAHAQPWLASGQQGQNVVLANQGALQKQLAGLIARF